MMPDIEPALHHQYIISKLEQVASGKIKRLMLFLPPGSAKSTYASVLFPPWFMGNHPSLPVIAASHSKELAERFGRRVRNQVGSPLFKEIFGFGLSGDSGAAGRWETARGGEYFAVGVDASVTGRRAALGIIDDPVKGRQEADSATVRQHVWDWYKSDFWTRLIPDAALIYIGTRWHDDDLAGRLLEEAKTGGEQWEVVKLSAEAKENDPLGRAPGERLWAEWFSEEQIRIAKRDARNWSALWQQEPMPESGDYFKAEWIKWYDNPPPRAQLRTYGASDYATKAEGGDFTVHLVVGIDPLSDIYLLDLWREHAASDVWVDVLLDMMFRWKTITWAEEMGQIKNSVGPFITKRQLERKIFGVRRQFASSFDKPTRAQAIRGRMAMGKVHFPRGAPWAIDLVQELLRFPAGTHDDQIDGLSLIGAMLDEMVPGSKPVPIPQPLDGATVVTGLQMPLDWHWSHSTKDAVLRLGNGNGPRRI
jgi:predicted phage terminase large subunit-like protein